jgi:hypothetical protein
LLPVERHLHFLRHPAKLMSSRRSQVRPFRKPFRALVKLHGTLAPALLLELRDFLRVCLKLEGKDRLLPLKELLRARGKRWQEERLQLHLLLLLRPQVFLGLVALRLLEVRRFDLLLVVLRYRTMARRLV